MSEYTHKHTHTLSEFFQHLRIQITGIKIKWEKSLFKHFPKATEMINKYIKYLKILKHLWNSNCI